MQGTWKKIALLAAGIGLLSSCAQDEMGGGNDLSGNDGTVTFTATLPAFATRAAGDGTTATDLSYAVYAAGETTPLIEDETTFTDLTATVSLRLVTGKSYDILFWASAPDAPYTVDFATQSVAMNYDAAPANAETRDAFFAARTALEVTGPVNERITLTRPFAQVNIGTDDRAEAEAGGIDFAALQTSLTVSEVCTTLNLKTGEVSDPEPVSFTLAALPAGRFTAGGAQYDYLSMNYLLMAVDKGVVDCEMGIHDAAGEVSTLTVSSVPVQRNYRTNVFGSLLTAPADFEVEIDPDFTVPDNDYDELLLAAQNGGEYTLAADVTLTEPLTVAAGKRLVINLDGNDIVNNGTGATLVANGELVIDGDGTVDGGRGGNNVTVWAAPGGKVTINGGTYTVGPDASNAGNSCIYSTGGEIVINGGHFSSEAAYNGLYYVLNLQNGSNGSIVVYGGTFENYDPAGGDDHDQPTNFVADGYMSEKVSDDPAPNGTFEVRKAPEATIEGTDEEYVTLAAAIAAADEGATITVSGEFREDLTVDKAVTIRAVDGEAVRVKSLRAEADGAVFEGVEFYGANGNATVVYVSGSATFRNCHFAQESDVASGTRPIEVMPSGDVVIEECTFDYNKAVAYFNPAGENGSLTIRNTTFARGISVELQNAGQPIHSIPVIEGCTLMGVSFTSQSGATSVETLSAEEKAFANAVLRDNEFSPLATSDGGKVRAYISGSHNAINELLPLAMGGGKPYASLTEAIAAATDGRIEIEGTFDLTEAVTFGNDVELVGNGATLTGEPVYFKGTEVSVSGVTFDNGTNASNNGSAVYVTGGQCRNITFENCTFTNAEWDAIQLTDKDIESVTIRNCTFRNTEEGGYRYIHLELRNGGAYYANPTARLTIEGCTLENVSKAYCKDSAITIVGFSFDNMNIAGNVVKGDGADALSTDVIWICNGINFSKLMPLSEIQQKFVVE